MRRKLPASLILPSLAVLVLLIDQISKHLVMTWLAVGQPWNIAPWLAPFFSFTYVTNTGVAFGLFPKLGNALIFVNATVVVLIILYHRTIPEGQWLMRVALGLQLGGAIGNIVDRLRHGFVVDFIDLNFWPLHNWAVFNLADSCVVGGVVLLALIMIWDERLEQSKQQVAEGS